MLLDFDGWMGSLPEDQRAGIEESINFAPEEERASLKQRLAAQSYVAETQAGGDVGGVSDRWDLVMPAYANEKGDKWKEARTDFPKFYGLLREEAQTKRDERHLLLGPDDDKLPDGVQVRENSLLYRAQEAAYEGKPYAEAVGKWQESVNGKPGYDAKRANAYIEVARGAHAKLSESLTRVRPIADEAFKQIATARGAKEGEGGDVAPFALFRGMSPEDKTVAFRLMSDQAGGEKSRTQAFFEAAGRGFENLATGSGVAAYRSRLLQTRFSEGDLVSEKNAADEVKADFAAFMAARSGANTGGAGLVRAQAKSRKLTTEEAAQWNQQITEAREDLDTAEQLRKFGQQVIDPTDKAGGYFFQKVAMTAADSIGIMTAMAVPYSWAPALELGARSYQNDEYERLRNEGMAPQEADRLAAATGMAQAALDKFQAEILVARLPVVRQTLAKFAFSGGAASRFLVNTAGTTVAETAIELTQDHIIPAIVQDNLASDPQFDVKWGEVWGDVAKNAPEMALGMVLLSGVGGLAQTNAQSQMISELGSSKAAMRARGYSLEQIEEIIAAPNESKGELLAQYLPAKAPEGAERAALVKEAVAFATEEQAAFDAKQKAETVATTEAADYAIRATRTAGGWQVTQADGATVMVDSAEAARIVREDLKQASTQAEAESIVAIIDDWHSKAAEGTARETTLTGEEVTAGKGGVTRKRGVDVEVKEMSAQALDELFREAQMDGQLTGASDVFAIVNGSNEVEFRERVADGARETVQRLELNQSESVALTAIHEQVEASWRTGIANGTITRDETRQAVQSIAAALDPLQARTDEERAFRQRVQRVATGKADETELRETISELAVAEVIGRRKDGTSMPAGSITAAVNAAIMNAAGASEVKALGKFRAWLRAIRQYFRAVFGTVAAIKKSRKEGGAAEFDALINKLLGLEQTEHETAAAEEALDYVEPTEEEQAAGIAFSLSSKRVKIDPAKADEIGRMWQKIGEDPTSRRLGEVSDSKDMATLLRDIGGAQAQNIEVAPLVDSTGDQYGVYFTDSAGGRLFVDTSGPDIYINSQDAKADGTLIYQAVYAWAHNNDRRVIGDPEGVSYKATLRRASHMLSSALRFGTTRHLLPHNSQGIARYWKLEDTPAATTHNIGLLAQAEAKMVFDRLGDLEDYSFRNGFFYRGDTRIPAPLRDPILKRAVTEVDPNFTGAAGSTTLARALATAAAQESGAALGERLLRAAAPSLRAITYRLSASNRLELIQKRIDALLADNPERARQIKQRAAEKIQKLKFNVENERFTGRGDRIAPISEKRTKEELDKEQAAREALRRDELIKEGRDEKQARNQAKEEMYEWRREQEAKMRKDWGRQATVRDLRTLDAILSVLPPQDRAKVGGFIKLASYATEEARQRELERRLEKIPEIIERRLRKEFDQARKDLFEKAMPAKDEAGKKKVGKAGADIHALFDTLRESVEWTPEQAASYIAGLDVEIASGELTPEEEAHKLQEIGLIQLFADWKNTDAARRSTAVENAERVFKDGYAKFQLEKAKQKLRRDETRQRLKDDTGKAGTAEERDARVIADNKLGSKWGKTALSLINFEQVLGYVFGDGSKNASKLADAERKASYQSTDEIQDAENEIGALFRKLAGDELKGSQLSWKLAQKSLDIQGRKLSEMEAITATLMWRQEDGRRHMEGKKDENGKVISSWGYDQNFINEIESAISDEAKAIRAFLIQKYGQEYDALNKVYRELNGIDLPKNPNYSPLTVVPQQAKGGQSIDPLTGSTFSGGSTTPGALRSRGVSIAEPDFRDALQTFIAHTKQMAHWKAYAPFINESQALLGNREVMNSVEALAGEQAVKVLRGWIDFFAQGGTRDAAAHLELNQTLRKLSGRAAAMALVGRASTLAIQSTQLAAGLVEMPTGAYLKRFGQLITGNLDWSAAFKSDYIQRRLGEMPPAVRAALEGLKGSKPNALRHGVQKIGRLIGGADALFTAGTFSIVYDYQLSQAKELGLSGAEAEAYARDAAERATDRVAQPTRAGSRSLFENTATSPFVRLAWAFASEARKNFGLMAYNFAKRPLDQKIRTGAFVLVLNTVIASMIRAAFRDATDSGDDDDLFDEKNWNLKRMTLAALTEPIQGVPVFGSMIQAGVYKTAGEWHQSGDMLSFDRAVSPIKRLPETLSGETEGQQIMKDLDAILSVAGLFNDDIAAAASLSHIVKDAFGAVENIADDEQ